MTRTFARAALSAGIARPAASRLETGLIAAGRRGRSVRAVLARADRLLAAAPRVRS
jgi:hypothetical protein